MTDSTLQMGKLSLREVKYLASGGTQLGGRPRLQALVIWLQSLTSDAVGCTVGSLRLP